jgi:hypothetical protein
MGTSPPMVNWFIYSLFSDYDCRNEQLRRCVNTFSSGYTMHLSVRAVILTLRVWAVWGKSDKLRIALTLFFILCWGGAFIVAGITAANQDGE